MFADEILARIHPHLVHQSVYRQRAGSFSRWCCGTGVNWRSGIECEFDQSTAHKRGTAMALTIGYLVVLVLRYRILSAFDPAISHGVIGIAPQMTVQCLSSPPPRTASDLACIVVFVMTRTTCALRQDHTWLWGLLVEHSKIRWDHSNQHATCRGTSQRGFEERHNIKTHQNEQSEPEVTHHKLLVCAV